MSLAHLQRALLDKPAVTPSVCRVQVTIDHRGITFSRITAVFTVLASNFGGGIYFAVFVGLPVFYGSIPFLFVIVLRRLLWFKRPNEMPSAPLQLGTLWCSSTLMTLVFIINEIVELNTPSIVWSVLISVLMAVIGYTLVRIRRDPRLNCWQTWTLGIILPGIAMSLTAMLRIWQ